MLTESEYTIVQAENVNMFETYVNARLLRGWELQGGVSKDSHGFYTQALIKRNVIVPTFTGKRA